MTSILLISNDETIVQMATQMLGRTGYEVICAGGAEGGMHAAASVQADAIILDEAAMESGVLDSLASWFRGRNEQRSIVFISDCRANAAEPPMAFGDTRLPRPVIAQDLRDAVAAAMRDSSRLPDTMQVGSVELDRQRLEVRSNGSRVSLTPTQFRVIECLAEQHGAIVPTDELLRVVWGDRRPDATPDLLRSHLHTLRERLRGVSHGPLIENVPHRGYRISSTN